ncbi:DNA helicase UvrD, partial [Candidatus Kaiserbacteria bacterium]|nr:DNA helicase UvrD [Candidatus Kaiserbacteria bacterium]
KTKAIKRYKDALRARARSLAAKRTQDKTSVNAKVLAWIGDRRLSDTELTEIGQQLLTQSYARRFVSPVNRYINGFHRRYSKFRKLRQSEGTWYESQPIESRDIHPLELDVIVLAILRASKEFLSRSQIVRQLDEPVWSGLKSVFDLYRHQILVDEATDFSPLQLACMAAITHPTTRSFFACGDFNQRLTTWGTRSKDEVKWIMPGLEFQEVNIAYRQTLQLNTLARDIVTAVGGNNPIVELPKNVDNEGVAPALLEEASDLVTLTHWLADRLGEIEQFLQGQPMPSTAIFVNSEDDVIPLAEQLDRLLIENNLRVVACSQGQIVGQDTDIRVFDIQHIKGLEFEAVFFVGVDSLAEKHPTLFDKYLYVGATRAATYLGLTCSKRLPSVIESLRPQFTSDWSTPARANGGVR